MGQDKEDGSDLESYIADYFNNEEKNNNRPTVSLGVVLCEYRKSNTTALTLL